MFSILKPVDVLDYVLFSERLQEDFIKHRTSYQSYLQAQKHRQVIQKQLGDLSELLLSSNIGNEVAQQYISSLQTGLAALDSNVDALLKAIPLFARQPEVSSQLAEKVFGMPELFEHILQYLKIPTLLQAQQVNRAWFDAIQSSKKLQRRLCLLPDWDCKLHLPFSLSGPSLPRITSSLDRWFFPNRMPGDNEISFETSILSDTNLKPLKIGSRCRSMYICQPPIKSVSVYTYCCHSHYGFGAPATPLETLTPKSGIGITVGDLLDAFDRIYPVHRLCPDAFDHMHDKDGFVRPGITFEARVEVKEDDPYLIETRNHLKRKREEDEESRMIGIRMPPYIAAKQAARAAGEKIPTLAEFEASTNTGEAAAS